MLDWSKQTQDPNNAEARALVLRELLARRRIHPDRDLIDYVYERLAGKRVLDIGVVGHTSERTAREDWRHARIARAATYCLGLDILRDEVERLRAAGYNVRIADATSDEDLGERFDAVFIGDVVEHVENPARLLRFAARHLSPGGFILASTPNPFSRKFLRQFKRDGTMVNNLDHVGWITPSMALELGRRAGVELRAYHLAKRMPANPLVGALRKLTQGFTPAEFRFPDYLYEYGLPQGPQAAR